MRLIFIAAVLICVSASVTAVGHGHRMGERAETIASRNCFDPSDPSDIRLWSGNAPGASGSDPCRDIPYLKMYAPDGEVDNHRAAILIIPGGGYDRLSDAKEQAPVAEYFANTLRVKAFVLYYRLVQKDGTYRYPVPMWDGRRALNLIHHDARALGVDPARIGVFGFSAGGHLASTLSLHPDDVFELPQHDAIDAGNAKPAFLGLGYPVISMLPSAYASPSSLKHLLYGYDGGALDHLEHSLSGQENVIRTIPPVFLFERLDDQRISPENSVQFAAALSANHVPADVHLFKHGEHGSGLSQGIPDEQAWPGMFQSWLQQIGFIGRAQRY